MKSPYTNELEPNQTVTATFLVLSKDVRQKKTGEPYLSMLFGDRTGDVEAKMWDNVSEVIDTFERDDFVKVKGLVQVYHNRPQLTVHKLRRVDDAEIDFADFFPASKREPAEMLAVLRGVIAGIGNPHLRGLLEALFADDEIVQKYPIAPAAKQVHHAYLGGLIEHVLSLCDLCRFTASHYRSVDLDLMLTGAILHDIGKIHELSYARGFGYTTEGQLLGHMIIGLRMIDGKLRGLPEFPRNLRTLIEHMIISHHGKLEFGSPKLPQFPEAVLLAYLDDLDSKMECMRIAVERDQLVEGEFTSYCSPMERTILKKARFLAGGEAKAAPAPDGAPVPAVAPAPGGKPEAAPAAAARPKPATLFADKLREALKPAEEPRGK
jgi:3'-5' exoribonuclease